MKLYGLTGKGSGKMGSSVFAISGGEQIVRQYNPQVSNPSTEAQVIQRAKLKLISQLAAALAPALGFTKQGLVSARNQFVSKNIGSVDYNNNEANVTLSELELTPSSVAFPELTVANSGQDVLSAELSTAAAEDIKRVAYFVFKQTDANKLEYVAGKIVSEAGANRKFSTTFTTGGGEFIVYAYGIKDNNAAATMRYEDYQSVILSDEASLEIMTMLRNGSYGFTATSSGAVEVQ